MKANAILLLLLAAASFASACVWAETVEAEFLSQNGFPLPGGTMSILYQRNVVNVTDTTESALSGPDGIARLWLCDQAPDTPVYDYNVTVFEPYGRASQFRQERFDVAKNGTNRMTFVFLITVYNLSVTVRDPLGTSVPGANITVTGPYSRSAIADGSGGAGFMLPPAYYTVSAKFGNITASKVVDLKLPMRVDVGPPPPPNNTLRVSLRDDLGAPLENASVGVSADGYSAERLTNASGIAEFTGIAFDLVLVSITNTGRNIYLSNLSLEPETQLHVEADMHPPNVTGVAVSSRNVGAYGADDYTVDFRVDVSDAVSGPRNLSVSLTYAIGQNVSTIPLAYAANNTFAGEIRHVQHAPFSIFYSVNASDTSGNAVVMNQTEFVVRYSPPPRTPTPTPAGSPTPVPSPGSDLPGPLQGLLSPLMGFLSSVSTYLWVMILLVVVILGGTIFVFLAVNAFFYIRGGRRKGKE